MIIAAHQPNFLPYLGLFYKIKKCEKFIFVDDVQFTNQNGVAQHRNYIKTSQGKLLIHVPVHRSSTSLIKDVTIDYTSNWIKKLGRTLYVTYGKALCYDEVNSWFMGILNRRYSYLSQLNMAIITEVCARWGWNIPFDITSRYDISGKKEEKVVNLVEFFGGTVYYSGKGAAVYLSDEAFNDRGITLKFSDYCPHEYHQLWGMFIPNLSVLDYLMNCGFMDPFENTN